MNVFRTSGRLLEKLAVPLKFGTAIFLAQRNPILI
jgi:hypothetical protein